MAHTFTVQNTSTGGLSGELTADGVSAAVPFGVPREFGGSGGEWTPEHLLAAATSTCVQATFLIVAQASKIDIASYESSATCTMTKETGGFAVTGVEISPRIVVREPSQIERAQRAIEKAETLCPISKALHGLVTVTATVEALAGE